MMRAAEVATALPLIRWRGWRPKPFDLERNEQGGQVFLVFDREDDLALLPTATMTFLVYEPLGDGSRWEDHGIDPIAVSHSSAASRHVIDAVIGELAADGWQVIGRLQATFHGIDTEDDFWARLDCAVRDADEGDHP